MVKRINIYPKDIKILRTSCIEAVPTLNSPMSTNSLWPQDVVNLVQNLKDTANKLTPEKCLGLSANQVWELSDVDCPAVFIMVWPTEDGKKLEYKEFINPKVFPNGSSVKEDEGCLSVPEFTKMKKRKQNCNVQFQTLDSLEIESIQFYGKRGPWARVAQHEADHLKGTEK